MQLQSEQISTPSELAILQLSQDIPSELAIGTLYDEDDVLYFPISHDRHDVGGTEMTQKKKMH